MDTICYEDILNHYQLKLKEAFDEVELLGSQLRKAEEQLEAGWTGPAAEACRNKLASVADVYTKALAEVSEAITKLSDILAIAETLC